jgi:DNA repair protein RecO (recombination protein O)
MPPVKTEALILNRRDFRETSLIAEFYTRDYGRLSGLLKGGRAESQKFASPLEPFSYNEIIFYPRDTSSLYLVGQCDLKDNFNLIRRDIKRVGLASLICELISAVMPVEDKNEEVFNLALNCLQELGPCPAPERLMTVFKIKLLSLSGFKPHFDSCVSCGERIILRCRFSLRLGGLLCQHCAGKDTASRTIFRGTVASILHIEKNELAHGLKLGLNPQIKKELELVLDSFLEFHLEKKLKTQDILLKLEAV